MSNVIMLIDTFLENHIKIWNEWKLLKVNERQVRPRLILLYDFQMEKEAVPYFLGHFGEWKNDKKLKDGSSYYYIEKEPYFKHSRVQKAIKFFTKIFGGIVGKIEYPDREKPKDFKKEFDVMPMNAFVVGCIPDVHKKHKILDGILEEV